MWVAVVGVVLYIQHTEKQEQERIAEQETDSRTETDSSGKRRLELKKCEEVLNWFREQEECTVESFEYAPGKIAGYKISWTIKSNFIRDENGVLRRVVPGKAGYTEGSGTWSLRFGTYEELEKIKKRFEDDKATFGPK